MTNISFTLFGSKQLKLTMMKVHESEIILNMFLGHYILLYELFWVFLTVIEKKEVEKHAATGTFNGKEEAVTKVTRPQGR